MTATAAYEEPLLIERRPQSNCAVLRINRPHVLNALSSAWWEQFVDAVAEVDADPDLRVGILTGAGRAFCSGRDLSELNAAGGRTSDSRPSQRDRKTCTLAIKPWICAVNGPAVGAGVERALDCDIRIAAPEATFRLPETRWGMVASTALALLPSAVPSGIALQMLLTGDAIDAGTAQRVGIVQEIVPADRLMTRAEEIAAKIGQGDAAAVAATKAVFRRARTAAWLAVEAELSATFAGGDPTEIARRTTAFAKSAGAQ